MRRRFIQALAAVPALVVCFPAYAEEREEQQFLFVLDPAYVQSMGEWQAGVALQFPEGDEIDVLVDSELEYGLTDRLQAQASVPFALGDGVEGIGDASFGLTYAIVRESDDAPALSVAVEAIAPTGDVDEGLGADAWGYGLTAALSKQLRDGIWGHANAEYERIDGASVDDEEADLSEWLLGVGAAVALSERSALTIEVARERERIDTALEQESEYETIAALGLMFTPLDGLEVGAAAVGQFAGGEDDVAATLKALFEW